MSLQNKIRKAILSLLCVTTISSCGSARPSYPSTNSSTVIENTDSSQIVKTCTVIYDANGGTFFDGSTVKTFEVRQGDNLPYIRETPTKDGFTFSEWKCTCHYWMWSLEDHNAVDNDIRFNANWKANIYSFSIVNENVDCGTVTGEGDYECGVLVTINAINNNGYYFSGWYDGDELISVDQKYSFYMPSHDYSLVAKWSTKSYVFSAINDDENKGEISGGGEYEYNSEVTIEAKPYEGHYFIGWYDGEKLVSENLLYSFLMPSSNYTLTARWDIAYKYQNNSGEITITGILKIANELSSISIPATIFDLPVKAIGESAFRSCNNLISITLPATVVIIGTFAFASCKSLTSIIIPSSVTSIGSSAFAGCTSLTSIIIPSSVTSIGSSAFAGCTSLTSIIIPSSVTSIGSSAFFVCYSLIIYCELSSQPAGWDSAWNSSDRPVYWGQKKVYYYDCFQYLILNNKIIITGYINNPTSIDIPETINGMAVIAIGDNAFSYCKTLTSVTIPSSVTSIGTNAFIYCDYLLTVIIPLSVTSIGANAFFGCYSLIIYCESSSQPAEWNSRWNNSNRKVYYDCIFGGIFENISYGVLTNGDVVITGCFNNPLSITIPEYIEGHLVTLIGDEAFRDRQSLTSITIPSSVTSIGRYAFDSCLFTSIELPSVTSIGDGAFSRSSIATIDAPSVTSIGDRAFYNSHLTALDAPLVTSIGDTALYWCDSLESVYAPQVRHIGESAFASCSNLTSIEISSVTSIGDYAFEKCVSLKYVNMPHVITIGNQAFNNCKSLISVSFSSLVAIGNFAFGHCASLTSINIPSSVTSIGGSAFYGCASLTLIAIPSSVTYIGGFAFYGCTSLSIYCESSSQPEGWDSKWNIDNRPVLWDCVGVGTYEGFNYRINSNREIVITKYEGNATEVIIPENINGYPVASIGYQAFYNCQLITSINIPSSVTSFEQAAFRKCASLTSINIPSSVTSIGTSTFEGCRSLTSINIPSSVTSIGDGAFSGCTSLASIIIPSSVTSIGGFAFAGCISLTSIIIPSSVTSIAPNAFYNCYSLIIYCESSSQPAGWVSSWNGPDRPVYWGQKKVYYYDCFQYLILNNKIIITGYINNPTSIDIPETINGMVVTAIGDNAFSYCKTLTSVTIPSSVTSIGTRAFIFCDYLLTVIIPSSVSYIGGEAFRGCDSLTIYCAAKSKPYGWNNDWNYDNRPVVWGYNGNL